MSKEDPTQPSKDRLPVTLRYRQPSDFQADELALFGRLERPNVALQGIVQDPIAFREALSTLFAIVSSDYRYVPKDRSAYLAFMQMRRSTQQQGRMEAQQAYFDWLANNDPLAYLILDPVVSVHPDRLLFEVFSKDEGCYAKLSFDYKAFALQGELQYGTTNIDFSDALATGIEQIRSYRTTQLAIARDAVTLTTDQTEPVLEKAIQVPHSWLRGFLQVQSSALLTSDRFQIKPIDLYNILLHFRMHQDEKGKRRGLRVELVPGEYPRLLLEPWETLITTTAEPYTGKQAKVVRLWGRRRLSMLKRFLPYTETIEVSLLGNGLPSYWILQGSKMTLTLAITGYTASNWSQALHFDLLLPREEGDNKQLRLVVQHLQAVYRDYLPAIAKTTGIEKTHCLSLLQKGCQQGQLMYDLAEQCYRYRPISEEPLDMATLQFRHPAERHAFDLITRQKAVSALQVHRVPKQGTEISTIVDVKEDERAYLTKLLINEEGNVAKAECSCHQILQHGLQHGPCSHLIALRIAYARHKTQQAKQGRTGITQETKRYSRRRKMQEQVVHLTLDQKRLQFQWGNVGAFERRQQIVFNSVAEARAAYSGKIAQLESTGYIDATFE